MAQVGYARVSAVDQDNSYEHQIKQLEEQGCNPVFSERVSAVSRKRPEFDSALQYLRQGDTLVVCKLDRLARSLADLMDITRTLEDREVSLKVLDMGIDTSTSHGRMVVGIIGSVAQFERELMLERQRIGIAAAKDQGKYKGRKPTAMKKAAEVKALAEQGVSKVEIAKRLGIGRASVYRALAKLSEGS